MSPPSLWAQDASLNSVPPLPQKGGLGATSRCRATQPPGASLPCNNATQTAAAVVAGPRGCFAGSGGSLGV